MGLVRAPRSRRARSCLEDVSTLGAAGGARLCSRDGRFCARDVRLLSRDGRLSSRDGRLCGRDGWGGGGGSRAVGDAVEGWGASRLSAAAGVFLYVQVRVRGATQAMLVPRMLQQVPVGDRAFLLRRYRRCFSGTDAVAFLLSRRFARTEGEAVAIGNALLAAGVFRHVRNEHRFRPGNYFYRFAAHEDYAAADDPVALRSSRLMSVATSAYSRRASADRDPLARCAAAAVASAAVPARGSGGGGGGPGRPGGRRLGSLARTRGTMSSDDATFCSFDDFPRVEETEVAAPPFCEEDVEVDIGIRIGSCMYPDLVTKFSTLADFVTEHRVNGRVHADCFLGKHAAKWLMLNKYVSSAGEAVAVGNAMLKAGVFFPVEGAAAGAAGFECNDTAYRMMADVDFSAELRRGEKKDFFLKYFLGIDRAKGVGAVQQHSAPWFEDSLSFSTTSSRGV